MTLREDIVKRSGSLNKWAMSTKPVISPQLASANLISYEVGKNIYLSTQMVFAKKMGLSLAKFREKYLTNRI